jgi:sigma-B regulation protein RsbU (phosphoserine phosphatase)
MDGGFMEDDKRFLGIVGTQIARVIENARLRESEVKLMLLEEDLKVARRIQAGFLPLEGMQLYGCQVWGANLPAKEVGGDYFDYLKIDDDRLFFSLGDVSGKGVPAALLMAIIQAFSRWQVVEKREVDLQTLAAGLNELICRYGQNEMAISRQYTTAILGFYDCQTRRLKFINGGHPPPLIVKKDGRLLEYADSDLIIGIVPKYEYVVHEVMLDPGDAVLLYSDGITEAVGPDESMFGIERLERILLASRHQDIEKTSIAIIEAVEQFCRKSAKSDDITLLAIKTY